MAEENSLPRTPSGQIVQPINVSAQSNQPTPISIPQQQAQAPYIPSNPDLQTPAMLDMQIVQQISEKANTNNKLLSQIDSLTTALSKGTVSPENQANLTPQQLRALQGSDMNTIAQQIGMVKWTMSARGQETKDSISYLLNGMSQIRQEQEAKRVSSRQNIMDAFNVMGSAAFEGLSENDKRLLEKNSGLTQGYLSRAEGALKQNERKAEEARQLQLEQAKQDMRLKQEQFNFSKQQAAQDNAFRERQLAFQKADSAANRAASKKSEDPIAIARASFNEELRTGLVSGKPIATTAEEEKNFKAEKKQFVNREQAKQYFKNIYGKDLDSSDIDIAIDQRFMTEEERKIRGR
jgi:hypothetical protein